MAEHNTEDARSSVPPRRGPRPFVGPSGGPGQPLPLLRATPTRPAPRPFVPAPGARPALGTTARPVPPVMPAAPTPAAATEIATGPAAAATETAVAPPVFDVSAPSASPAAPPASMSPDVSAPLVAPAAPVAATPVWLAAQPARAETAADLTLPSADDAAPDRFAAFDVTWQDEPVTQTAPAPASDPSLLEVGSLGSGQTDELWAADIVSEEPTDQAAEPAVPAWLMDDVDPVPTVHVTSDATAIIADDVGGGDPDLAGDVEPEALADPSMIDGSWADATIMPSADAIMAVGLEPAEAAVVDDEPTTSWPDPLLAEYAPYVPTPTTVGSVASSQPPAEAAQDAPSASPPSAQASGPEAPVTADIAAEVVESERLTVQPPAESVVSHSAPGSIEFAAAESSSSVAAGPTRESLVAASLNRLAERVRDGQIDVSSVAPEGSEAAVLAAVLAALLGGGRSSSR